MRLIELVPTTFAIVISLNGMVAAEEARTSEPAIVRQVCSECHAVNKTQLNSPNPAAPRFQNIARISGMTSIALTVALRTSHRSMPNLILSDAELQDVIAYILDLK